MAPGNIFQLFSLVALLGLSAFFSSAETSFVSVNLIRIRALADDGSKAAARVVRITDNSAKMLSAILIGNNLVNITASSLATTLAMDLTDNNYAVSLATGLLTVLVLIFGEITPKTLATLYPEKLALIYSRLILMLMWCLTPVIYIINKLSMFVLYIMRIDPNKRRSSITDAELRTMVEVSHEEGLIENEERDMIKNVFDFGDSMAKDVMIPRIDMVCISIESTYKEIIDTYLEYKYTRFPVYKDSVDNVIGIINVKDLLAYSENSPFNVNDILRQPYYTYEFKKTFELMEELRKTRSNITIVLDEYGSTVGMISLEDLLEEIVGEIRDEYDDDEEDMITTISPTEYILSGMTRLDDIDELLNTSLESDDYDSISGLVIDRLDRLPQVGDTVQCDNITFQVDEIDKNRINKVHVYIKEADETTDEEE